MAVVKDRLALHQRGLSEIYFLDFRDSVICGIILKIEFRWSWCQGALAASHFTLLSINRHCYFWCIWCFRRSSYQNLFVKGTLTIIILNVRSNLILIIQLRGRSAIMQLILYIVLSYVIFKLSTDCIKIIWVHTNLLDAMALNLTILIQVTFDSWSAAV